MSESEAAKAEDDFEKKKWRMTEEISYIRQFESLSEYSGVFFC